MRSGDCLTKGTKKEMGTGACALVTFDSKSVDGFKWNGVERSKASEIKDKKRSDGPNVQTIKKERPFRSCANTARKIASESGSLIRC